MARKDFGDQLRALGYEVTDRSDGFEFPYEIPVGSKRGQQITLGLQVGDDFPANPPGGPNIKPHLLPFHANDGTPHPYGAIHASPFGSEWQYWSRPFTGWAETTRDVKTYMGHIRALFNAL